MIAMIEEWSTFDEVTTNSETPADPFAWGTGGSSEISQSRAAYHMVPSQRKGMEEGGMAGW